MDEIRCVPSKELFHSLWRSANPTYWIPDDIYTVFEMPLRGVSPLDALMGRLRRQDALRRRILAIPVTC